MSSIIIRSNTTTSLTPKENPLLCLFHGFFNGKNLMAGSELIGLLKKDPQLNQLYSLSAGVGEECSIEEHTHMVLDSFTKEFITQPQVKSILESSNLSSEQFLLFLALHDIGKGRAVKEIADATPARKELELKYTQEEVFRVLKLLNLETLYPLFEALLADDSIGDLMKASSPTNKDMQQAAQSVEAGAKACSLPTENFLDLKILFHKIDAASYKFVRIHFF